MENQSLQPTQLRETKTRIDIRSPAASNSSSSSFEDFDKVLEGFLPPLMGSDNLALLSPAEKAQPTEPSTNHPQKEAHASNDTSDKTQNERPDKVEPKKVVEAREPLRGKSAELPKLGSSERNPLETQLKLEKNLGPTPQVDSDLGNKTIHPPKTELGSISHHTGPSQHEPVQATIPASMADKEVMHIAEAIQDMQASSDRQPEPLPSHQLPLAEDSPAYEVPQISTDVSTSAELLSDEIIEKHIAEAIELEDQQLHAELQKEEYLRRQVSIEETRIKALASIQPTSMGSTNSGLGHGNSDGRSGFGNAEQRSPSGVVSKSLLSKEMPTPFSALSFSGHSHRVESGKDPAQPRTRSIIQESINRIREATKSRQSQNTKIHLNIQIDDSSQIKLSIRPNEGGGHHLMLLVSNGQLRNELRRSAPELQSATEELPIEISEIVIESPSETDFQGELHDKPYIPSRT